MHENNIENITFASGIKSPCKESERMVEVLSPAPYKTTEDAKKI